MLDLPAHSPDHAMKDPDFYRQLGRQIAQRRKALGLTQTDLAEHLGIAQQTMAHYEGGTARIAVAMLPTVARVLDVSIEELIGTPAKRTAGKRGPASKLQQQLERISQLPRARQRIVSEVLDSLLAQAGR
ncbi:helix-turn-helix domain-containing protein [Lysobacter pythonis]|uniref:Helix-turn-helix domain-containing protein n=1 Tax=Solilutibacter pythonis TaxID=2483112 RepID=A0A3M2I017_9GAMM|nr:helix-turn-helix domain-containing protein [Lysobacter pythonis]RMH93493.1 helix-turn-helix domain-containing protein [Lysobacter pythonis]